MVSSNLSLSTAFFKEVDITQEEFATLRGFTRPYAMRTIDQFLSSHADLSKFCQTLLAIGSDSFRAMAGRLKKFSSQELGITLAVGEEVSFASVNTRPYGKLFADNKELWIWATSPMDMEHSDYWEKLCSKFLCQEGRMLVYFVPRFEIANQLALRFETELLNRLYDAESKRRIDEKGEPTQGFGATIFIVITNLALMTPYVVITNPGSGGLRQEGMASSGWILHDKAHDMYELSDRFSSQLIQHVRAAGLGLAGKPEDFFPWGGALIEGESGVPLSNYRYLDRTPFEITHAACVGLFDGNPLYATGFEQETAKWEGKWKAKDEDNGKAKEEDHDLLSDNPLKIYPIFIRSYRKKAKDTRTRVEQVKEKKSSRYNRVRIAR